MSWGLDHEPGPAPSPGRLASPRVARGHEPRSVAGSSGSHRNGGHFGPAPHGNRPSVARPDCSSRSGVQQPRSHRYPPSSSVPRPTRRGKRVLCAEVAQPRLGHVPEHFGPPGRSLFPAGAPRTPDAFTSGLHDGRIGSDAINVPARTPGQQRQIATTTGSAPNSWPRATRPGGISRHARPGDRWSPGPRASHGWPHTQPNSLLLGRCRIVNRLRHPVP